MLTLTEEEKQILDGRQGAVRQKALELIVRYGEVIAAERLCRVTWADLFCGAHGYLQVAETRDFDPLFSKMSLCSDETVSLAQMDQGCVCYSGVEADCSEVPAEMLMDADKQAHNRDLLNRFVDAGVILSGNCIPYLTGFIPAMGEHFVSCESSAVLFMNSLWGACGNGDGIEASFCAAVCGRTPAAGMHLPQNRFGTHQVEIAAAPRSVHDWDLLGYSIGSRLPAHSVPVIVGDFARPNTIQLKAFFAALACAAGTEMAHFVGMTPEAPTRAAAFGGRPASGDLRVGPREMVATLEALNPHPGQPIDYVTLGCPHYHIDELRKIAHFLAGRRFHAHTRVDIWTTGPMKYMADRAGYTATIEAAGGRVLTGSCPSTRGYPDGVRTVAYDSVKQRHSAEQETDAVKFYGSRQVCLASALSGRWEGGV